MMLVAHRGLIPQDDRCASQQLCMGGLRCDAEHLIFRWLPARTKACMEGAPLFQQDGGNARRRHSQSNFSSCTHSAKDCIEGERLASSARRIYKDAASGTARGGTHHCIEHSFLRRKQVAYGRIGLRLECGALARRCKLISNGLGLSCMHSLLGQPLRLGALGVVELKAAHLSQ